MKDYKPYLWRIALTVAGLLTALLFLLIGFWRTLIIVLCCTAGFTLGWCLDKKTVPHLPKWLQFWITKF